MNDVTMTRRNFMGTDLFCIWWLMFLFLGLGLCDFVGGVVVVKVIVT